LTEVNIWIFISIDHSWSCSGVSVTECQY